jgi:hypothetical protein
MTIKLQPGHGAELPWAEQPLRFGMTLDEVGSIVKPYTDLHDTFVCNTAWAKRFTCDDLEIVLFAGEDDALLGVSASHSHDSRRHVPVGLDDIDLFGWPVDEVIDALRHAGRDVQMTDHTAWVDQDLHLMWPTSPTPVDSTQRKPRRVSPAPPPLLDALCLYASRRPAHHDE